jgi:type IV pilus assembly protein PilX
MKGATYSTNRPATQRGAVLITALVILFILTLLGVAGMQSTVLEERMAGNYRDRQVAFEAAEAALRAGEARMNTSASFHSLAWDGSDFTYEGDTLHDPLTTVGEELTDATLTAETVQAPVHYIERLPEFDMPKSSLVKGFPEKPPKIRYYRTTARGWGKTVDAEAVLQSTYFR